MFYIQVNTLDSFTGKAFCSNLDIEKVKRKKGKSQFKRINHKLLIVSLFVFQPYQPFGGRQGGGGAPNRTESGRVAAGFRADPELRFARHASKANVDPNLVSVTIW